MQRIRFHHLSFVPWALDSGDCGGIVCHLFYNEKAQAYFPSWYFIRHIPATVVLQVHITVSAFLGASRWRERCETEVSTRLWVNFCFGRCNHHSPTGYRCKDSDLVGRRMLLWSGKSDEMEDLKRGSSEALHCKKSYKLKHHPRRFRPVHST